MRLSFAIIYLSTLMAVGARAAEPDEPLILKSRTLHLGVVGKPEWQELADRTPDASRLDLTFEGQTNEHETTLFIHQDGVRQDWKVELNGKRIGKLFLMEADLIHTIPVSAGVLRDGANLLSIAPLKDADDVILHKITLDPRPPSEAVHTTTLDVNVTDVADQRNIPCRLTIVDALGALAPLLAITNLPPEAPFVASRPGVVYTGNGRARLGLPTGDYIVYASRGFEWSVATQQVRLTAGQQRKLTFQLRREVSTPGWVSCDTHVHTFTHSRHGDATIEERMLTLAGEGIEMPIASEHNLHVDYSETARHMGVADHLTAVTGNEVTTPAGHFNIFPVDPSARVPDFLITDWPTLMRSMRSTPDVRVIILNHPRNVHQNFQPFAATNFNAVTAANKRGPEFTFDAMEVLNSSAQQSDYMLVYRDWFALWNHGYRITGIGSSDGHDVSRYVVGQSRTYISTPDAHPGRIDVANACSNLLAARALVSMGLMVQMTVNGRYQSGDVAMNLGQQVPIGIKVLGPSWTEVTNVSVFANGVKVYEQELSTAPSSVRMAPGEKAVIEWRFSRPAHDVHLVAIATGPGIAAPFWAIPRPYQPASMRWQSRVIGSTNPILLDADGDGKFTPAREYAKRIVSSQAGEPRRLLATLEGFDEAVAAQAAGLLGDKVEEAPFQQALAGAAPHVQRGFAAYSAAR